MWRDRQDLQRPEPDSPMKQMARQLFASEAQEETNDQLHIRQANLADRFGKDLGPVQELMANLDALAQGESEEEAEKNKAEGKTKGKMPVAVARSQPPEPRLVAGQGEERAKSDKQAIQQHPMLRPVSLGRPQRPQAPTLAKAKPIPLAPRPTERGQGRFASLQEALAFSRDRFPLPKEIQLRQKPEHQTWLLSQVQACHNEQALRRFAYSLSTQELAILFPCLASLKTGSAIDKLLRIIALRASHYLYLQGWITLQYAYPRSTVQKGLALLCEILEDKTLRRQNLTDLDYQGLMLGSDRFDWASVRLISEISLPNTRHFMSTIIKYLRDSGLTGAEFFQRYGIYRDLALGQAIISQWDMAVFESNLHSNHPLQNLF